MIHSRCFITGLICLFSVSSPAFSLEKVILQLEWKHQFEFAGFYAAKAQGYYQQAGLEVEIKERTEETRMTEDILSGKATYGIASAQIIMDRINHHPVVLLASYFKQNALALVVHPSIKTPSDLIGKTVMLGPEDLKRTAISIMMQENHVPFDSMTVVLHKYNVQDFIDGKVDAMSVFVSNELFYIEQSGIPYNLLNPAEYGVYSMDVNVFSSENEVKQHPDRVKRFLKATKKGWQYALKNKEEIVDLIIEQYSKEKSKEALLYEAEKTERLIKPDFYEIGSILPEIIKFTNNRFLRVNQLPFKELDEDFIFSDEKYNSLHLTDEEQQYLKQKQQLKMCVDPDWMPYEKIENGQHVGMSADFIQLFSKKINIPIRLVASESWLQSLVLGKQRKCDIFSLVMSTPEREKWLDFSKPYLKFPLVIATDYKQIYINDIKDVLDKKIAIQKGYAYAELLRLQYPELDLVEVNSLEEGLNKVRKKEILGMVGSLPDIAYAFQTKFMGSLKIAGKLEQTWVLSVGTRNDEPLLKSIFDKAIAKLTENEKQDIISRWVSVNYSTTSTDYKLLFQILTVVFIIFIFFLYHHIKLRSYSRLLEYQSVTDRLTSIYNRMKLDRELSQSLNLAVRYKQPFSVIIVDADYFKAINDKYGHLVGDYALKTIAQILKENIRMVDTIGRWGGEEFLIICPAQTDKGAVVLANKLCAAINSYPFGYFSTLTCSFGVSSYKEHDTEDDLIKRADDALYKAKEQGRNQVCLG